MADLEITYVTKRFGSEDILNGISLDIVQGECVSLVGPSGCGKSTLLKIIAGRLAPTSGHISLAGKDITALRPENRNLPAVFQTDTLCPRMTVAENIAKPLRQRDMAMVQRLPIIGQVMPGARHHRDTIDQAVSRVAQMLEIGAVLHKKPGQLSGGQYQRVILGRTLVQTPQVVLLDDPLSNLDARHRGQIRAEITRLRRKTGATIVYATNDQTEAMAISDRIAVMADGKILQCAPPEIIYEDPDTIGVAAFIGSHRINILPIERDGAQLRLFGRLLNWHLSYDSPRIMKLGLRPESLRLSQTKPVLSGRVAHLGHDGPEILATIALNDDATQVTLRASPADRHLLGLGATVGLSFDTQAGLVFDPKGNRLRKVEATAGKTHETA